MNLIFKNINAITPLTKDEENTIASYLVEKQYKTKTLLLNAGEVCKSSYFVKSGVLRSFTINDNIIEHILHFACKGWWIGDMYSLISQKPGHLFIEVLEDAETIELSKENQEILYKEVPKLERFFRILTENSLVSHQERIMNNLSLTVEERFINFKNKYPELLQKVPQKHIASYLGVTPEFYSKMKKKLLFI
jgi:CRP/FNR family transcriptional regulator, anaerobic regulatory protein